MGGHEVRSQPSRSAMAPVGLGIALGVIASVSVAGLTRGLLYGVEPGDPIAMGVGLIVLLGAAFMAALIPARRASRVDPMPALRPER